MAIPLFLLASILLFCLATTCYCYGVSFASLEKTLVVEASTTAEKEVKAGEDQIIINWSFNTSFPPGTDSNYRKIKIKLCFAPISQIDRAWRKTNDDLKHDKTCLHNIVETPYKPSNNNYTYTVKEDVPTATYFVRAYVHNCAGDEVGYGQHTYDVEDEEKLFRVKGIDGRNGTVNACAIGFTVFSVVSGFGFIYIEYRKSRRAAAAAAATVAAANASAATAAADADAAAAAEEEMRVEYINS